MNHVDVHPLFEPLFHCTASVRAIFPLQKALEASGPVAGLEASGLMLEIYCIPIKI